MEAAVVPEAVAALEIGLPERLALGRGNAFVLGGYCYHPRARTRALALDLGGRRIPVEHFRLPRQDLFEAAAANGGVSEHAFRSGFLAFPRLEEGSGAGEIEVGLVMTLEELGEMTTPVGRLRLDERLERPAADAPAFPEDGTARVAICMATYDPPTDLLRRQLDSLRKQTHRNWVCVISDDCSRPERFEALTSEVAGDERFVVSRSERHLGFYGNFERALTMAPPEAGFITLCDQDDRWRPEKLERLLGRMGDGVQLAYSDLRVVDPKGGLVHPSYWTARNNNYTNLGSLLIANTVTGAASLFRSELLDDVLPFPPRLANPFHDHWLALVACARGRIDYVDEPLYDYVQHAGAVIGHSGANRRTAPVRDRLRDRLRRPGDGSRVVYYYNWSQQLLFAEVLRMRCADGMEPAKRRSLRRFLSVDSGPLGLAWLIGRRARRLWGRNETMDIERYYAKALLRQRLVSLLSAGRGRPGRWLRRDASIPPYRGDEA